MVGLRNPSNFSSCDSHNDQVSVPYRSKFIGTAPKREYCCIPQDGGCAMEAFAAAILLVMSLPSHRL
jgi:hypothetical protein